MGKGTITEILHDDEGNPAGEYMVLVHMDMTKARAAIEAYLHQLEVLDIEIDLAINDVDRLERTLEEKQVVINRITWLIKCTKYGFGDQRMYIVQDPSNPMTPPIPDNEKIEDYKRDWMPVDAISKPKKEEEKEEDYSDDYLVIGEVNQMLNESKILIEDIYYDPITGNISRRRHGEVAISDRIITDVLYPANGVATDDIVYVVTKNELVVEKPYSIIPVDVSDPENPHLHTEFDELQPIMDASMAQVPISNTPLIIYATVGDQVYAINAANPENLLSFGPLPLSGGNCAIGLDADGNPILMAWDKNTQTASLYDLDPANLDDPTRIGSEKLPGSEKYFEQMLINYYTGVEPGCSAFMVASAQANQGQKHAGLYTADISDKQNIQVFGPFQEFANNVSYYYDVWESKYSEDTIYVLECTDSIINDTKTLQEEVHKQTDAGRKWVQHWRCLVVNVKDIKHPVLMSAIQHSNPGTKQQNTSPTAVIETPENALVIVGETTEPPS